MCFVPWALLVGSGFMSRTLRDRRARSNTGTAYPGHVTVSEHRYAALATVGGSVTLIGTFLPWVRSGSRNRSSYTIFDLVDRLGFAPSGMISWSLRLWPLVPLLVVLIVVAGWWPSVSPRVGTAGTLATAVVVVWLVGTAISVSFAPDIALFRIGPGPPVTVFGVIVLGVGAVLRLRESAASAAS